MLYLKVKSIGAMAVDGVGTPKAIFTRTVAALEGFPLQVGIVVVIVAMPANFKPSQVQEMKRSLINPRGI